MTVFIEEGALVEIGRWDGEWMLSEILSGG
jgi:hypothetical protein